MNIYDPHREQEVSLLPLTPVHAIVDHIDVRSRGFVDGPRLIFLRLPLSALNSSAREASSVYVSSSWLYDEGASFPEWFGWSSWVITSALTSLLSFSCDVSSEATERFEAPGAGLARSSWRLWFSSVVKACLIDQFFGVRSWGAIVRCNRGCSFKSFKTDPLSCGVFLAFVLIQGCRTSIYWWYVFVLLLFSLIIFKFTNKYILT